MIVATEWRFIGWDECPPAMRKAYNNLYEFGEQLREQQRAVGHFGMWAIREGLAQVMKNFPRGESRYSPFFFALRGFYDGLAQKKTDEVGAIIAAHFPHSDDADRIMPKEIGEFLAEKFPGKGTSE